MFTLVQKILRAFKPSWKPEVLRILKNLGAVIQQIMCSLVLGCVAQTVTLSGKQVQYFIISLDHNRNVASLLLLPTETAYHH